MGLHKTKTKTHYTHTGPYAGATFCGAERGLPDTQYIHPRIDYTPADVCPVCHAIWEGADTEEVKE